jgi:hypothetical protein
MGSCYATQAGPELLGSRDPPASAFSVCATDVYHWDWLCIFFNKLFYLYEFYIYKKVEMTVQSTLTPLIHLPLMLHFFPLFLHIC